MSSAASPTCHLVLLLASQPRLSCEVQKAIPGTRAGEPENTNAAGHLDEKDWDEMWGLCPI